MPRNLLMIGVRKGGEGIDTETETEIETEMAIETATEVGRENQVETARGTETEIEIIIGIGIEIEIEMEEGLMNVIVESEIVIMTIGTVTGEGKGVATVEIASRGETAVSDIVIVTEKKRVSERNKNRVQALSSNVHVLSPHFSRYIAKLIR